MSAVQKGWIATGLYCAIAIMPGVKLILAFLLAWGMLVTFAPMLSILQVLLSMFGAQPPHWLVVWLAIAIFAALLVGPTLRAAWRSAPYRHRWLAVTQAFAMWTIGIAASLLAARALDHIS